MVWRVVAPCIDCGGDPHELTDRHEFARVGLFDGAILCDFCDADMPSTHPRAWGFPETLDWDTALANASFEPLTSRPPNRPEWVCPECCRLLRRQEFVLRNAKRWKVTPLW